MRIRSIARERYILAVILIAYTALAITYSVVTPLFEASDELWHYPFVKFIADTRGALPIQDPANLGPWKQEGSQPPLYYYLGALLTFWMDTSDMPSVRRENPHVDNGIITPDGNINLVVHNAQAEAFPWRGTALAVHIVRLLSVLMGVGTVYCTYALARELFPDRAEIALGAAALVAFTPMFLFISGSVNNDNLAMLLAGMLLLLLVRLTRRPASVGLQNFAVIGVVAGAGLLTKYSLGFLLPLAGVAFVYWGFKNRNWRLAAQGTLLAAFLTILIAGWWYQRNVVLYGDITGLNVFVDILGRRQVPADLAQLWRERNAFLSGYWGVFGGLNVPMASWTYPVFNAIGLLGLTGLAIHLARRLRFPKARGAFRNLLAWDFGVGIWDLLVLAWPVLVFVSWTRWASVTWSSQGRLVFSGITAITIWVTVGLTAWFPQRYGSWALGTAAAFFLLCAALAPSAWIAPAYAPPPDLTPDQIAALPNRLDADFHEPSADAPAMRLLGFKLDQTTAQPGDQLPVTLYWEVLAPMSRNWSVFLHLEDLNRTPVAQRDTYAGVGLLATGDLLPGQTFADHYVIEIPPAAYTPDTLTLTVGLYDYTTCPACERMRATENDCVGLHEVELRAVPGPHGVPNPLSVNFGDQAELVGYALDRRQALPGESITLTLYWQGLRQMEANYTVFAHVLGENNRIWANGDSWPAGGAAPTSAWVPGEIVEDAHTLTLARETPASVYPIEVGLYVQTDDGGFERLVVVTGEGTLQRDFVYLSRVRVGE